MPPASSEYPVLVITNGVLLPGARFKIPIRSKNNVSVLDRFIINRSTSARQLILIAYRIDEDKVFEYGTIALVEQVTCFSTPAQSQYTLHLQGISRAKIVNFALPVSEAIQLKSDGDVSSEDELNLLNAVHQFARRLSENDRETKIILKHLIAERQVDEIADFVTALLSDIPYATLLDYLGTTGVSKRVRMAIAWCKEMAAKTASAKSVPLNAKRIEGGSGIRPFRQGGKGGSQLERLAERLQEAKLPENVRESIEEDLSRLKMMNQGSQELTVLTSYLEFVADLPWGISTPDSVDLKQARELLDATHEGMETVKKRLLEYMAVRQLSDGKLTGPILCLHGPPGCGKTSIAKIIAESLGRKFERISLGGIRDEADIRGHRRTYIGAMPGRILQAVRRAKTNNPVILLDEVDKLFAGLHGSPSAALLEVLDPEQNSTFVDHYLNLPFDLSNVIFVATANDTSLIDGPLSDRLEIIEMTSYSSAEKIRIAMRHVIGRQLLAHGICPEHLRVPEETVARIVSSYTREAGVRQLTRHVASLCRHAALTIAEALNCSDNADCVPDLSLPIVVQPEDLEKILGPAVYAERDIVERTKVFRPGMVYGLAWTPFGGELMLIEAVAGSVGSEKTGKIVMTGKLGDVLKESVEVALSHINANAERLSVDPLSGRDIHVHLPSGAVGKDGPSAGCAIATALFSLASRRVARSDTAITGEISLSGHVLPVGGIKEKVLGAHRAGLRRVILPEANKRDAELIDETIKSEMSIEFVREIDEVLEKMMSNVPYALSKL